MPAVYGQNTYQDAENLNTLILLLDLPYFEYLKPA